MDSPRISFDEESQPQSIKDPKKSNFCKHVAFFLLAFILVTLLSIGKFAVLYEIVCPVNSTYPLNHELFLRNFTFGG